jgi:peptide deformylase
VSAPIDFAANPLVVDELVRDLFDTLYASGGVGLSAIQIGVPLRVFVMDVYTQDYVFLNPALHPEGQKAWMTEGCLSLPNIYESVLRYPKMRITAFDRNGQPSDHTFEKMEAQCVQHEYDHLDGIVIPDKLEPLRRTRLAAKLSKKP